MDQLAARAFIDALWDAEVIPELADYIRIPNKSPAFDPDWEAHGHMEAAVTQFAAWASAKIAEIDGASLEVVRLVGRTPVILIEIPGAGGGADDPVLLYGHLDKQPEMTGWAEGLGPWQPVLRDGRLFGRGGADDGYAMFGALSAILALKAQGVAHARCNVLIEACEESGSYDLPPYVDHLAARLGSPSLVVCLDSGCANYDQLWLTTSLRGMTGGALQVQVLAEGVHSGDASGIVPSSFRILRSLLSRIEDEATGEILPSELHAQIPPGRIAEAKAAAAALGDEVWSKFPFVPGMHPVEGDAAELILNRTWRPALSITGLEGAPEIQSAGNVLRPATAAKLSLRLPPTSDAEAAGQLLKTLLEADPPYGARVTFDPEQAGQGWNAPALAPWLRASIDRASQAAFGREAAMMGEGGSIPFMGMLGEKFPAAQFVITGVLGPHSNAHGPNEFLHIAMGKAVSLAVAQVLADHFAQNSASQPSRETAMPIEMINPAGVAAPIGHYSHMAVVPAGHRLLLLSGQVGVTLDGTYPEAVEDQFDQAVANIGAVLAAEGATFADVAKVTYYFVDRPADFARVARKMTATFTSAPAATLLFVAGLASRQIKVEVEVIAAVAAAP